MKSDLYNRFKEHATRMAARDLLILLRKLRLRQASHTMHSDIIQFTARFRKYLE